MQKYMKRMANGEWRVNRLSLRARAKRGRSNPKKEIASSAFGLLAMTLFLFTLHYTLSTTQAYAWGKAKEDTKDPPAATQVIEAANERLNQRVEELFKENTDLKGRNLRIQAEITNLNRDRGQVLDKLKIITEENNKLKEMILYLQTGVLNMDDLRKQMTEDRGEMTERIKELEKEVHPVAKVKKEFNARLEEERRKFATQNFELQTLQSEVRKYETKVRELETKNKGYKKEIAQNEAMSSKLKEEKLALMEELNSANKKTKETLDELADANKDLKQLKKETADMHYNLGVIFQQQTKWPEAIREYEKVLEVKPDDKDAHFNLALIYDSVKNDRTAALLHYRKYLRVAPDSDDAAKIKERVTELGTEDKIWGEPGAKNIREKQGRW